MPLEEVTRGKGTRLEDEEREERNGDTERRRMGDKGREQPSWRLVGKSQGWMAEDRKKTKV